jgi:hypothetical protein
MSSASLRHLEKRASSLRFQFSMKIPISIASISLPLAMDSYQRFVLQERHLAGK